MKECINCGFHNQSYDMEDCPKCGAIYAKMERAQLEKQQGLQQKAQEAVFSSRIATQMKDEERTSQKLSRVFGDEIEWWERDQYPHIDTLSGAFIFFAGLFLIAECAGAYWLYQMSTHWMVFSGRDLWFLGLSYGFYILFTAATMLALAAFLKMQKDIANNTRATKELLRAMARNTDRCS